ncbi:MAG: cytochrome-c peroxidase [Gammaproteobacteria bacterium]
MFSILKRGWWVSLLMGCVTTLGLAQEPIQPLPRPQQLSLDAEKVALGDRLYHDKRLSADNTVSCASCHPLSKAGSDNLPVSVGIKRQKGHVNSPSVFNSGFNKTQCWDGRANTLEQLIDEMVTHPLEMGSDWEQIIEKLSKDAQYVDIFKKLYLYDGITAENITAVIADYVRSLITPDNAFDNYLRGDVNAISADAKKGYELFKSVGCIACHHGINVGGDLHQKFGIFGDYFGSRKETIQLADYGRFNVTGNAADSFVFRVPSLRNVVLTSPYFHDASVTHLDEAVRIMAKYQLGRELNQQQIKSIIAFLATLSANKLPTSQYAVQENKQQN